MNIFLNKETSIHVYENNKRKSIYPINVVNPIINSKVVTINFKMAAIIKLAITGVLNV